jgi:hypothetical protein
LLKKINLGNAHSRVAPTLVPWFLKKNSPGILLGCGLSVVIFAACVPQTAPYNLESSSTETRGETFHLITLIVPPPRQEEKLSRFRMFSNYAFRKIKPSMDSILRIRGRLE